MSISRTSSPQQQRSTRHRSQPSLSQAVQPPNARMSPASRYHSNLKVLRRRDPSIVSIFDQFSHVCVYHHNGSKWEKHGYEGSMFLYERDTFPPYGFYILNRVGSEDYIYLIYPEDDIKTHGGYLMLRSYPKYTQARLASIHQAHPPASPNGTLSDKFSPVYAFQGDGIPLSAKGESQTIGLWTLTTDGREPLSDVMLRLHTYVRKNQPYPEEFRYGPDRPPPPNPYLRPAMSSSSTPSHSGGDSDYSRSPEAQRASTAPTDGLSELDKLFAKFLPPAQSQSQIQAQTHVQASAPSTTTMSMSTPAHSQVTSSSMSVRSLFATVGGTNPSQNTAASSQTILANQPTYQPSQAQSPQHQQQQPTGIPLLDTIFASAYTPSPANPSTMATQPANQPLLNTLLQTSQARTQSLSQPPSIPQNRDQSSQMQVLSPNVIGTLLGYTSASAGAQHPALSTSSAYTPLTVPTSVSMPASPSHTSSQDGDNEDESDESPPGTSSDIHPSFSNLSVNGASSSDTRVNGDVTPRPPYTGFSDTDTDHRDQPKARNGHARPSVPFEPHSSLWPTSYRSHSKNNVAGLEGEEEGGEEEEEGGSEIVELDFSELSALSDPDAFSRMQQKSGKKKQKQKARDPKEFVKEKKPKPKVGEDVQADDRAVSPTSTVAPANGTRKKKARRGKNKKDRLEAIRLEKEDLEKDWGFSETIAASASESSGSRIVEVGVSTSVPNIPQAFHSDSPPASPSPQPSPVYSPAKPNGTHTTTDVQADRAITALLASLSQPQARAQIQPSAHEMNVFIREVLKLIQTDIEFRNTLWQNYHNQSA